MSVLLASAFVVVAAFALGSTPAGWVGFGVFLTALLAGVGVAAADSHRASRGLHLATSVVAAWAVVAAVVFSGGTLTWLLVADGLVLAALAVADLVAHELTTERVVHTFEVSADERVESTLV